MAIITEDYVSFETAKLLKEKGFNEPCNACRFHTINTEPILNDYMPRQVYNNKSDTVEIIGCPTLQMAMKWLREVYELYIEVSLSCDREDKNAKIFDASIFNLQNQRYKKLGNIQGYEEASEAAIKYCLKSLI